MPTRRCSNESPGWPKAPTLTDHRPWPAALAAATITCGVGLVAGTPMARASLVAVAVIATAAAAAFVAGAVRHARITRRLRTDSTRGQLADVRLRVGSLDRSAFVAGLSRPEIFCDCDLLEDLTADELRAVVLHERAHQLARDPLRMVATATIAPVACRFDAGRNWLSRLAARREIAADAFALESGASRAAIASALLKVGPVGPAHAPAFTPAVDARLQALLGDEPPARRPARWSAVVGGAALGAIACLVMLHPLATAAGTLQICCP